MSVLAIILVVAGVCILWLVFALCVAAGRGEDQL